LAIHSTFHAAPFSVRVGSQLDVDHCWVCFSLLSFGIQAGLCHCWKQHLHLAIFFCRYLRLWRCPVWNRWKYQAVERRFH
jgi:hypothetical protein